MTNKNILTTVKYMREYPFHRKYRIVSPMVLLPGEMKYFSSITTLKSIYKGMIRKHLFIFWIITFTFIVLALESISVRLLGNIYGNIYVGLLCYCKINN